MNFPFGTTRKLIILGVPILKHIRVICIHTYKCTQLVRKLACSLMTVCHKSGIKMIKHENSLGDRLYICIKISLQRVLTLREGGSSDFHVDRSLGTTLSKYVI